MSDAMNPMFPSELLAQQAQANVSSILLATIAYLKEQDLSPGQWATFVGQRFAPSWEEMKGHSARDIAEMAALNMASGGATLQSVSGNASNASAVLSNWPSEEILKFAGISRDDADTFLDVFNPIAEYLGLHFSRQRQGNKITLTFATA
jgi:hypothetical protein